MAASFKRLAQTGTTCMTRARYPRVRYYPVARRFCQQQMQSRPNSAPIEPSKLMHRFNLAVDFAKNLHLVIVFVGVPIVYIADQQFAIRRDNWYMPKLLNKHYPEANESRSEAYEIVRRPKDERGKNEDFFVNKSAKSGFLEDLSKLNEKDKICVIVNVGRSRHAKSTNSSIESLLLCEHGCRNKIGPDGDDCTAGLSFSPPLKASVDLLFTLGSYYVKPGKQCKVPQVFRDRDASPVYIVIVDVEGLEGNNADALLTYLDKLKSVTSVFVHSLKESPNDDDIFISREIHGLIDAMDTPKHHRPQYMMAWMAGLNDYGGDRWDKLTNSGIDRQNVCELPLFGGRERVGKDVKAETGKSKYCNLLSLMDRKEHVPDYVKFGVRIVQNATANLVTKKEIKQVIETLPAKEKSKS